MCISGEKACPVTRIKNTRESESEGLDQMNICIFIGFLYTEKQLITFYRHRLLY